MKRLLKGLRKIRSEGYNSSVYLWTIGTMEIILAIIYMTGNISYLAAATTWLPVGAAVCIVGSALLTAGLFSLFVESKRLNRWVGRICLKQTAFALNTMTLTVGSIAYILAAISGVGGVALAGAVLFAYLAFKSYLASGWPDTPVVKVDQEVINRMKAGG